MVLLLRGDATGLARGEMPFGGRAGGVSSSKTDLNASTGDRRDDAILLKPTAHADVSSLPGAVADKSNERVIMTSPLLRDSPEVASAIDRDLMSAGFPTTGDLDLGLSPLNE